MLPDNKTKISASSSMAAKESVSQYLLRPGVQIFSDGISGQCKTVGYKK
jgi:hypothetical protein